MTSNERGVNEVNKSSNILQYALPTRLTYHNHCFGLKHLDTGVANQAIETKLEKPEWKANQSALAGLLVCASVTNGIEDSRHNPTSTEDGRRHGEPKASNEQGSDEAGLVLEVVTIIAKSAFVLPCAFEWVLS